MAKKTKHQRKKREISLDLHSLYEAAVQNVEADADFVERVFRREAGRRPHLLREDFCGSASLACHWASRHASHLAWGVDLDEATLEWGRRHRLAPLGEAAERVTLERADVRSVARTPADVQVAFNFSYFVFRTRQEMLEYFRAALRSLRAPGCFFLDLFGGTESMCTLSEYSEIAASRDPDGRRVPSFRYTWDQAAFNPIDHRILCHIHFSHIRFKPKGKKKIKRAFTYDWRLWTIPEICELLGEAGFAESKVYVEGWDDEEDESDGIFRLKKRFDNEGSWIAYVVGFKRG